MNSGSPEDQQVFLTTELSIHLPKLILGKKENTLVITNVFIIEKTYMEIVKKKL